MKSRTSSRASGNGRPLDERRAGRDVDMSETGGHPWMGNSIASIKKEMLAEIGVKSIAELFEQIPKEHRLKAPLKLPPGIKSEAALRRHLTSILAQNESCEDN